MEIFDKNGMPLKLSTVIQNVLGDQNNSCDDRAMTVIGLRGMHNETVCLYHIANVDYEPHSINAMEDID